MSQPITKFLAALLCLFAVSCSGGDSPAPGIDPAGDTPLGQGEGTAAPAGFGGMPSPGELLRETSEPPSESDRHHRGGAPTDSNWETQNFSYGNFMSTFASDPQFSSIAYATYLFVGMDEYAGQPRVQLIWKSPAPNPGDVFVGFSHWANDRWQWFTVDPQHTRDIPSFAPFSHPESKQTLAVVVVLGDSQVELEHILLGEPLTPRVFCNTSLDDDPQLNFAPLTVTFDASHSECIGSPIVAYDFDWNSDAAYDVTGDTDGIEAHVFPAGDHDVTVRIHSADGQTATRLLEFVAVNPNNLAPTAAFSATPSSGDAPLVVELDPADSFDPDGTLINYEWDLDGDGEYEIEHSGPEKVSQVFGKKGENIVSLRVTDNDLKVTGKAESVILTHGWNTTSVAVDTIPYREISVCTTDSGAEERVCVAWHDGSTNDLLMNVALNPEANMWAGAQTVVGGETYVSGVPSIAFSPATQLAYIAYSDYDGDAGTDSLCIVRSTDTSALDWEEPVVVSGTDNCGSECNLAFINTIPCITTMRDIYNHSNSNVVYFQANDLLGTSWQPPAPIVGPVNQRAYTTPALVMSGSSLIKYPLVAFCYHGNAGFGLSIYRSTDVDGNAWAPVTSFPSMAIDLVELDAVNGRPAMLASNAGDSEGVYYSRALDAEGLNWPQPEYLALGHDASLIMLNGKPSIAYVERLSQNLVYRTASDVDGSAWDAAMPVHTKGDIASPELVEVNGKPVICFFDGLSKVVRACWLD